MCSLFEIARRSHTGDPDTKALDYYRRYDAFFRANDFKPTGIIEIGVHRGESAKVFAQAFPAAKIVALDRKRYDLDFRDFPNIAYRQADQTNGNAMKDIIQREMRGGFDLVIDDASHIGAYSKATFDVVFPLLKAGGIYIIEDWGTGYWDDFPDGSRFQEYPLAFHDSNVPRRIPSHDFGMVGFVKSLVDLTSEQDIRTRQADAPKTSARIAKLEFSAAMCIAMKAKV